MLDGYDLDCKDGDDELSDLDEYLTEYVDGTMDPATREAFEEYLEAHPELVEHICCLNDVRCALGQLNCTCQAPAGVQTRLRQLISCDMLSEEASPAAWEPGRFRMLAAAAAAVVLVSVGAAVFYSSADPSTGQPVAEAADESTPKQVQPLASSDRQSAARVIPWAELDQAYADGSLQRSTPYSSPWLSPSDESIRLGEGRIDPSTMMMDRPLESAPFIIGRSRSGTMFHQTGASRVTGRILSPR